MEKPIKETPILTGRDAVNFFQQMKDTESKKISKKEKDRMKQNYECLKSIER